MSTHGHAYIQHDLLILDKEIKQLLEDDFTGTKDYILKIRLTVLPPEPRIQGVEERRVQTTVLSVDPVGIETKPDASILTRRNVSERLQFKDIE